VESVQFTQQGEGWQISPTINIKDMNVIYSGLLFSSVARTPLPYVYIACKQLSLVLPPFFFSYLSL
jgi:hypothetical protein